MYREKDHSETLELCDWCITLQLDVAFFPSLQMFCKFRMSSYGNIKN